ncbi:Hypothetical protein A7982_01518 [Minicystis rosea]|nr:Hypothetical protein A7982_01518 [Minicystis rosea]
MKADVMAHDGAASGAKPQAGLEPDPAGPPPDKDSQRRSQIEQGAAALGKTWAQGFRDDLHREGRLAAGGWPGTLKEARARIGRAMVVEARGRRKTLTITEAERELAARAAYASARDEWRRHSDPEPR